MPYDWPAFLDDFHRHWPTDEDYAYVDFVREGDVGDGAARSGDSRWSRVTELRAGGVKSIFHFDVQGSVAKSTHTGLPWLRHLRWHAKSRIHFWPFDGWAPPAGKSVIVEVYPALWSSGFASVRRTADQHDAWSVAVWMRNADSDGALPEYFTPRLTASNRAAATIEGWILGLE